MSQSEVISYLTIMMTTFFAMGFIVSVIDKKFSISAFIRKKFNIDKRSKAILYTAVVIVVFYLMPSLIFRFDYFTRPIFTGITLGIASSISNRIQSLIVQDQPVKRNNLWNG